MTVEGAMDRANETMEMRLWASGTGSDGLEIKVEGGKAYGRVDSDDDWDEIENPTGIFAPGGDPLGFLTAAENIRDTSNDNGQETASEYQTAGPGLSNSSSYSFDINGAKFGDYMRSQLEAELRRQGELPPGVTLGVLRQYREMTAHGEIWLNEDGLLSRQEVHLEFPPEKGALEWVEADITTTFSRWDATGVENQLFWAIPRIIKDPSILTDDPLSLVPTRSSLPPISDNAKQMGITLVVVLLLVALTVAAITHRLLPQFYGAIAVTVALSLILTPLLQVGRVSAFTGHCQGRRDNVPVGRSKTVPPNVVEYGSISRGL